MKKKQRKALQKHQAPIEKLRVMAEYGSSGLWAIQQQGVFRHGMLDHADLALPQELAEGFTRWIAFYEKQISAPLEYDVQAFNTEGRRLAEALKRHVGNAVYVEFESENSEGGLCQPEEILQLCVPFKNNLRASARSAQVISSIVSSLCDTADECRRWQHCCW